eukprot:scaffold144705_cov14-Tisochrysis_lutea.AAC.2
MGSGGVKTGRIGAGGYVASAAVYLMQHILQRHRAGACRKSVFDALLFSFLLKLVGALVFKDGNYPLVAFSLVA